MNKIIHHIRKHHRKYIFAAGTAIGLGIIKIVAIIAIFFGITITAGRSNAHDEKMDMYQAMNIFYKINEIADAEMKESIKEGDPFMSENYKKEYQELDNAFHDAKNLNERYNASKKIVEYLIKYEKIPHIDHFHGSGRDEEFKKLLQIFNQIR